MVGRALPRWYEETLMSSSFSNMAAANFGRSDRVPPRTNFVPLVIPPRLSLKETLRSPRRQTRLGFPPPREAPLPRILSLASLLSC